MKTTLTTETTTGPFYVVTPAASGGVYGFATEAEADSFVEQDDQAARVPAEAVDPEMRKWHEDRLAAAAPRPESRHTFEMIRAFDTTPATNWAWSQVSSPNLNFDPATSPTALVLLAYARRADEALSSPSGYTATTVWAVASLLDLDVDHVVEARDHLRKCGLLVVAPNGGSRVSEDAFA